MLRDGPGGAMVDVRVIPRAARSALAGERDGALLVRLAAPPVDGAANAALIDVLAEAFGVSRRSLSIVHGDKARQKRVLVAGVRAADLAARLRPPS